LSSREKKVALGEYRTRFLSSTSEIPLTLHLLQAFFLTSLAFFDHIILLSAMRVGGLATAQKKDIPAEKKEKVEPSLLFSPSQKEDSGWEFSSAYRTLLTFEGSSIELAEISTRAEHSSRLVATGKDRLFSPVEVKRQSWFST